MVGCMLSKDLGGTKAFISGWPLDLSRKWKKVWFNGHTLYDSIYRKCLEYAIHKGKKLMSSCQGLGIGSDCLLSIGFGSFFFFSGVIKMFSNVLAVIVAQYCEYNKKPGSYTLKWLKWWVLCYVNFTLIKKFLWQCCYYCGWQNNNQWQLVTSGRFFSESVLHSQFQPTLYAWSSFLHSSPSSKETLLGLYLGSCPTGVGIVHLQS